MARRRKKKQNSFAANIKYEIYGILIIIFSVLTLAGNHGEFPGIGPVGRSLSDLSSFLAGGLYFVIPLIFIYVGLYVMVKRAWPRTWSYRKTGLLLAIMAMLITYHMILIGRLDPAGEYTAWMIIKEPFIQFSNMFKDDFNTRVFIDGGGVIGAVLYGILYFLFSDLGSKFIVVAMFAIAFICLTGLSYVELIKKLKGSWGEIVRELKKRSREMVMLLRGKRRISSPQHIHYSSNEEYNEDEEHNNDDHHEVIGEENESPISDGWMQPDQESSAVESFTHEETPPIHDFQSVSDHEESSQDRPYELPPFHLLSKAHPQGKRVGGMDIKTNARKLEATLESFGVRAKVLEVVTGPAVTRYEIQPDIGVKVSRIVSLTDDIALALAAKDIRIEAPIPGKSAVGIEVPNTEVSIVTMREVMESPAFHESDSKLSIALGRDIAGQPIVANLAKMPHLLVAGATGSGKSVCINGIIVSILYKAKPNEVKFLMIDPKKVELNMYNGIPHLLAPVVTDPRRASLALKKVVGEMEARYELFSQSGTRNIEGYNESVAENGEGEPLPYIVVIVDELADLMMVAAKDVEDSICRLAQMARAAGIHLIIATQRPSVDVITGLIKANIPSRIAFGVSSQVDSRTILDTAGAEKLLGRGDMLFLPVGASKPLRVQGAFLSDMEVESVVTFVKNQAEANYQEEMVPEVEEQQETMDDVEDELFDQAVHIVLEAKQASVSLLQRRMRIGYTRAARLIDSMEAKGIVGPYEGSKPREVLITLEQYQQSRLSS